MTFTAAIARPAALTADQLGVALTTLADRVGTAGSRSSLTRIENQMGLIADEIARRGFVFHASPTGDYMVGRAADFQPIGGK